MVIHPDIHTSLEHLSVGIFFSVPLHPLQKQLTSCFQTGSRLLEILLIAGSHGRCQEGDKHNKFRCQHHGFNIDCHNTADNSQYSKRYGQLKPRSWLQPSNHKERVGMDMLVSMSTPIRVTQVWQNLTTSQSKSLIEAEKEKIEKSLRMS